MWIEEHLNQVKAYMKRYAEHTPDLFAIRKTLFCPLNKDVKDPQRFFNTLYNTELQQLGLLGLWWSRNYISEMGNHYHVVLFTNPTQKRQLMKVFSQYWSSVTSDAGIIHTYPADDALSIGSGQIDIEHKRNLKALISSMQNMLILDRYLRLSPQFRDRYFGIINLQPFDPPVAINNTVKLDILACRTAYGEFKYDIFPNVSPMNSLDTLEKIELFVERVVQDDVVPFLRGLRKNDVSNDYYHGSGTADQIFNIATFVEVANSLSSQYVYNEHMTLLIDCLKSMVLPSDLSVDKEMIVSIKKPHGLVIKVIRSDTKWTPLVVFFNELVAKI